MGLKRDPNRRTYNGRAIYYKNGFFGKTYYIIGRRGSYLTKNKINIRKSNTKNNAKFPKNRAPQTLTNLSGGPVNNRQYIN
jgi:hypothetical protein